MDLSCRVDALRLLHEFDVYFVHGFVFLAALKNGWSSESRNTYTRLCAFASNTLKQPLQKQPVLQGRR